ncbi:MAG: N-acetylglucosamine kinase [Candidatus Fimadaptatus sp.]|jgi:glucosamine kinase
MAIYITLDAGGSKCSAIMFDDELNILGRGLSGGVNTTQTSLEDSRANMVSCMEQMFAMLTPKCVAKLYLSFVGPVNILMEEFARRTEVRELIMLGEPKAGLLAGGLRREGMLAIAGTGSDVFYITEDGGNGARRDVVGAYGPILGDQGSGTWIGQRALRAAVKAGEGWGRETILRDLIKEAWGVKDEWGFVDKVHGAVAPFRMVASVAPLVGKAAHMGDEVALDIMRGAGKEMALQTLCLIERVGDMPKEHRFMVACGGAWKAHPLMFETFKRMIQAQHPEVQVEKPCFEHVMCGPVDMLLRAGLDEGEILRRLRDKFADYVIKW